MASVGSSPFRGCGGQNWLRPRAAGHRGKFDSEPRGALIKTAIDQARSEGVLSS
jgi:hypothetical protein